MRKLLQRFDLRISLLYGIAASLWIIFSDKLLVLFFHQNESELTAIATLKGMMFVVVTSAALYFLVRAELRKRERIERALQEELGEGERTLEALRQSESRFATIFHAIPIATSISTAEDGMLVDVNDAFVNLFGYNRSELIGCRVQDLALFPKAEPRSKVLKPVFEHGQLRNLEVEGQTKPGDTRSLLVSVDLLALGSVPHIITMLHDITERKRTEEQLQYQALVLAQASDAIISTDVQFIIQSWNSAAEAIYGWRADEVVGKPIQTILDSEFLNTTRQDALSQLQSEGTWRGEATHQRKDGSRVYVLASTSYVTDSAGNRIGVVSVNRDISARRQAEIALRESETRFRNMADAAPAMLWASDASGEITFPSRGWLTFTGQTEAGARGWGWMNALHPDDREPIRRDYLEALEKRAAFQFEYRLRFHPDGEYRSAIATGNPYLSESGEFLGYVGSVIDVTEHQKAQRDLQAAALLRLELEKEKEYLQLKERFISIVSHEFRTPLSVIVSSTELVQNFADRMPRQRQIEHLDAILTQSEFMVKMLDDVLTVNKAQSGKLEFKPTTLDLKDFCMATLERLQVLDKGEHEFVFTTEGDCSRLKLDTKLLQHILVNLLSNAIKYSPDGGEVRFEVQRLNNEVEFKISDRGIGIPAQARAHLFEPFYRANNTGEIGGTGLGLAIVKESVDLHKGTILCESQEGVGTTFTVRLPTNA